MKGLNSPPSFELIRGKKGPACPAPQPGFHPYFLSPIYQPPTAAPAPQPRAFASAVTFSHAPGSAGSSEPDATGGAGQIASRAPRASPWGLGKRPKQMELEAGPQRHSRGPDHPRCFSGRAPTWLLWRPGQASAPAPLLVPGPGGLLCCLHSPVSWLPTTLRMKCVFPPTRGDARRLPEHPTPLHLLCCSFAFCLVSYWSPFRECTVPL